MSKVRTHALGFDYVMQDIGHTAALFTCSRCPETITIRNVNGQVPEVIADLARKKGWVASHHRKQSTVCPHCQAKKLENDPESELKKFLKTHPPGDTPMGEPIKLPTASLPAVTPEQRLAIRHQLDKHFDDSAGRFLDGMSDRAIGEKVGVGAAVVKQIRETAYGPERSDPEVEQVVAELGRLKSALLAVEAKVEKLLKR